MILAQRLADVKIMLPDKDKCSESLVEELRSLPQLVGSLKLDSGEEGVVLQLADGKILGCNTATEQILGSSTAQLTGSNSIESPWQTIHEDGSPFPAATYPTIITLKTGKPCKNVVMGLYKPNGQLIWLLINSQPLFQTGKTTPNAVVTSFADVTAFKHWQNFYNHNDYKNYRSRIDEARFFEISLDLLAIATIDGYELQVNPSFTNTLGYSSEQLRDRHCLDFIHPDDREATRAKMQQLRQGTPIVNFENRFRCQDGSYKWIVWAIRPIVELGAIYCSGRDITSAKQLEAERDQILEREKALRAEAENANLLKDQFLAILGHELRSPLNPILGWSKLLKSRSFDEATILKGLNTIERNAKLQIQLIDDLLDVSRILRGKLNINKDYVDLAFAIESALETVRASAVAKSIQIHMLLDSNVGQVNGDINRLLQVINNLLNNAVKFTPKGGQIEVCLSAVDGGKYAQIIVADTGIGIDPEFITHVFEYFRQADNSTARQFGGLGLGLAIVRELVEMHGGTVTAASAGEGLGATFTVTLPLVQKQEVKAEEVKEEQQLTSSSLAGVRLLIVDDEPDAREFLRFLLEQYGAEVTVATSAKEVLAELSLALPDMLISDLGMPEVDGYELIRQVRAIVPEQGGKIPAIALTAYAGETDRQQVLAAGFQKHIAKPVSGEELVVAIVELLG